MNKYKKIPCPICNSLDKGKRKICLKHKIDDPTQASKKGEAPFRRI